MLENFSFVGLIAGVFFLGIDVLSLITQQTGTGKGSQPIRRREHPVAFWAVVIGFTTTGSYLLYKTFM